MWILIQMNDIVLHTISYLIFKKNFSLWWVPPVTHRGRFGTQFHRKMIFLTIWWIWMALNVNSNANEWHWAIDYIPLDLPEKFQPLMGPTGDSLGPFWYLISPRNDIFDHLMHLNGTTTSITNKIHWVIYMTFLQKF